MPERDGYIPGVPCWVDTSQPDPQTALAFYGGLFGWEFEDSMPPEAPGNYYMARLRGGDVAAVSSQPEGAPPGAVWNTYIWVDSADETASKVADAGGRVLSEPFDIMDAGRMGAFTDPEGAAFCVWQAEMPSETLGTFNAALAEEFWRAVAGNGLMNLHIVCHYGRNAHHIIEAIFKATARALRQAVEIDPRSPGVPSTKGVL